jgi:hypothetical protein
MSATPQQICAGYTNMAAIAFIYAQWCTIQATFSDQWLKAAILNQAWL